MRRVRVQLFVGEDLRPTPPPLLRLDIKDIERVQWYLTQRWFEFAREHGCMPKTIEGSAYLHACFEASLAMIQRFTTNESLYEGTPTCLMFKSCKLFVNPDLKGFDLRIS